MIYLFWAKDMFEEPQYRYRIEASSLTEAKEILSENLCFHDESFLSDCYIGGVNFGFAEKFWLQGKEEEEKFSETGEASIDFDVFKKRVFKFFRKHREWADLYIKNYIISIEKESDFLNPDFSIFTPYPQEMLKFMWDRLAEFDGNYSYVMLDDIKMIN